MDEARSAPASGNELTRVLVVDDSPATIEVVQRNLESRGFLVFTATGVPEALEVLESTPVDLIITDMKMPGVEGIELIRHVRENYGDAEVIMITGYPSIEGAVAAVKTGAEEYLSKPFTNEELFNVVDRTLDKLRRRRTAEATTIRARSFQGLLGNSAAMQEVFRSITKAASTPATVLITGESGTGKELIARAIHYTSDRVASRFVTVNCGGVPEGLLESELFGHMKGSFTGATESRAGFFQTADGGTIFLDEISETSLAMQVKLLRVLQDGEVHMVGSSHARSVDVRVLAASNMDLPTLIDKGQFRKDLYFRLNVIAIHAPPLAERGDDVLLLTRHFAEKFAAEYGQPVPVFDDKVLELLGRYSWPGNVRELENLMQRLVVMADEGAVIQVSDLPEHMRYSAPRDAGFHRSLAEVELEYIRNVLAHTNGNKSQAARILGIDRKTLRDKLKLSAPPSPEARRL